ncbi:triose-phosphate isomerase [Jiella sp. MQZ9-1]|uniref:Triosephosphate isomerase n=1 Tax=Jiella flava TaxID=2816857 RepID=A0A939G0L2_9HYPH|nr:triose-phosphate isomerase [Jiella flava]MBO0662987.1 triose-phosphate isomerase [Jiella flava]MCD2471253.1 triose-phosphate isomerase [Jiella flava]
MQERTIVSTKRPFIGTSWKMNKTRAEAAAFCQSVKASPLAACENAQLFVIPPFTVLTAVAEALADTAVIVGAQNAHWQTAGAWTGEISPLQVKDAGGMLVEIGHSERRTFFNETDETVALKTAAAVRQGLTALVCIGDTLEDYQAGRTAETLRRQTEAALSKVEWTDTTSVIFAYEPVWSIGDGGTPADPSFADEQQAAVKALIERAIARPLPVLYGGSVNPTNCVELATRPHIDGLFIGRSAWDATGYLGIVRNVIDRLA